ncbi:hypothetical protein [Thioalkalivibrio sp.]|uniref:hypothetical protein n=1 Tax=Thioalkalivibrio sp. TaxID=2093813 RepID=UPI003566810B
MSRVMPERFTRSPWAAPRHPLIALDALRSDAEPFARLARLVLDNPDAIPDSPAYAAAKVAWALFQRLLEVQGEVARWIEEAHAPDEC